MGAQIRALRERKAWTLADLGNKVGLSKQGVCRIERGEVGSPPSQYDRIARALGASFADLLPTRRNLRRAA